MSSTDSLDRLAAVIESRKPAHGGDPDKSYVARLLHKGPDAFLKKIGEEATEVVMAAGVVLFPEALGAIKLAAAGVTFMINFLLRKMVLFL